MAIPTSQALGIFYSSHKWLYRSVNYLKSVFLLYIDISAVLLTSPVALLIFDIFANSTTFSIIDHSYLLSLKVLFFIMSYWSFTFHIITVFKSIPYNLSTISFSSLNTFPFSFISYFLSSLFVCIVNKTQRS